MRKLAKLYTHGRQTEVLPITAYIVEHAKAEIDKYYEKYMINQP